MNGTILVIGGTGKTGLPLAKLLQASNHSFLLTSRSGNAPEPFTGKGVKFDWHDESTYENPFKADSKIDRVYIILPFIDDPYALAKTFIDLSISKGVKRFVLLSGSAINKGDIAHGKVHEYLDNIGVEYTTLRPTWFIENFGTVVAPSIRDSNIIVSAKRDGRVSVVATEDIAYAAYDALVSKTSPNTDFYVIGPTPYNWDEVAALLSEILGRKITHVRKSVEEMIAAMAPLGLPPKLMQILCERDEAIANGAEEALVGKSNTIIGKRGPSLREYFEANKHIWIK